MAKVELSDDTKAEVEEIKEADLLIAIAGPVETERLRTAVTQAILAADEPSLAALRTVVAFPGASGSETAGKIEMDLEQTETNHRLRFRPYAMPPGDPSRIPWLPTAETYQALFALAREMGVGACAVIGSDLAALRSDFLGPMMAPVLAQRAELAMPLYAMGKFDGLLNSSILAPLTRALYGRRVRFPLASDFCFSRRMIPDMETALQRTITQGQTSFWPATEAAIRDLAICQVQVGTRHSASADGVDLSTVMSQTVGPLFGDIVIHAPFWQRVRGSQPLLTLGAAVPPPADAPPADTKPMVETFQLGFRNLQEVWGLVLPPVTLLELKRLARPGTQTFHMPDELWVRIVYDFVLAYRLRTIGRSHLLGAMTPLYLGWVASYALEVGSASAAEAEQRIEKLARAYEEEKPYLLQRWRWPDRFNP